MITCFVLNASQNINGMLQDELQLNGKMVNTLQIQSLTDAYTNQHIYSVNPNPERIKGSASTQYGERHILHVHQNSEVYALMQQNYTVLKTLGFIRGKCLKVHVFSSSIYVVAVLIHHILPCSHT